MLEGSLGAKPNSHDFHYPIVATGTVQETTVIAFATGNNVDIYDGSYNLLQQLAAEDKVNCVAIQPGTNIIAFTSGSKLHFYYLEMNSEIPLFWKQQKIYEHPCEIGSIDWGSNGTLLVAGQTTCILKLKRATINPELLQKSNSSSSVKDGEETDQNLILQQQLQFQLALEKPEFVVTTELSMPFQPVKCQYSPCSKFFAVYGKDNRHVLIWYERQNGDNFQYEFALLPHQLSIINIEWRYPCNSKQHRSAILTLCNDNIARLWAETDQGFGFHTFNLCGSIDPQKQSVGNYESFENNFPVGSIHWLTGRALSTALNLEHQAQSFKKTLDHIPPSKLTDTLHEFPDMLYAIKPNGSMIIWGIQGLGSNPTRVVKIALIMKTDNTVLEVDHSFFNGMVLSFCNRSKESCHNSPEIQFLGQQNEDHVLNSYSMNLDDFFSHDWSSPRLLLVGSWCGPRVPIVEVIRHSVMPYVALLDQANELSIFSASIPKSGLRSTTGLTIVTVLPSGSSCLAFAWIPTAVRCTMAVAYQDQLSIYTLDDVVTYIGTLNNFPTSPISKLMIYPQNKISECNSFYILASTKSGLISLWSVSIDYDKLSVQSTHIGTQSFPENSEFFQTYALDHDSLLNADQIPSLFATFLEDTFSIYHFQNPNIIPVEFQLNDPFINISSFKFTNPKGRIKVKFAIFGKLAIAHHLENDYIIDIWDNEADGLEMTLEYQLKFNSPIVDIDWLTCNDGQHILLVAFPQSVALYIKSHFQFGCIWKEAINIPIEEPQRIISCAWLSHGSLLVSTNVKSAIYSPWVEIAAGIPSHLFEISSVQSGRLSDHDPNLLFNYMLWGKYDLVKYNLSMLHRFTKLSLETSKPFSKIPFPLWKLTSSEESTDTKPVYDDLFSDSNQEDLNALGVFGKTQIDYLLEHLPNSTVANADKLVGFIKAFEKFEEHRKSLDQNGGRYLLTAVYHFYMNTLNLLTARDFTWAFFSDSQEYIIDTMTQMAGGKLLWNDAKNLGFGWWISNGNLLKKTFEVIARNQYWGLHGIHDPVACSLYYLGLKKKNVLVGLWKLASTHPEQAQMMKFLANDFNEDRWKNAALKNAYALLGKQRYEYSAAFFLLADRLKDAVNVCVKNLNDPQLAISLCRVYEGENGPVLLETLKSQLIPNACQAGDRWVSCILWTYYNNRDNAFYSITRPLQSLLEEPMEIDVSYDTFDPNLLLLYYHLKVAYKSLIMAKVPQLTSAEETHLLINCAQSYDRLGCPGLALELIVQNKLDQLPELEIIDEKKSSEEDNAAEASNSQTAEGIDWGEPVSTSQSGGIDWGEPVSKDSGGIDWGEPVTKTSGGIDWGESESKVTSEGIDWGEPEKPAASGGLDWGDMTTTITNTGLDFDELDTTFPTEVEDIQVEQHVPTHQEILKVSKFELLRLNVRLINMNVYKGILTRRILHAIHHSLEMISDYKEELKGDAILSDYTGNLRKGIISLANLSNMTVNQVGILIMKRCQEMFSFNAFVELLPFEANNMAPFVIPTQQMIINQTNILCYITFQNDLERQSKEKHHLVDLLSKNILIGWVAWYKKSYTFGTKTSEVVMTQAVVAGYMIQVVTAALFKRRNRLWWMLGLCEQFFDTLLKSDGKGLCNLIEDALAEREPIAHPVEHQDDSDKHVELYDEFGIALYNRESPEAKLAEQLIHSLSLSHITGALKMYLERVTEVMNINPGLDETFGFLSQALHRHLVKFVFNLDIRIANGWSTHHMELDCMSAYILETQLSELWSLLNRTGDTQRNAKAIITTKPLTKQDSHLYLQDLGSSGNDYDTNQPESVTETVVISEAPINAFAINPIQRSDVVFVTSYGINEVDATVSCNYFTNTSAPREISIQEYLPQSENNAISRLAMSRTPSLSGAAPAMKRDISLDSINQLLKRSFQTSAAQGVTKTTDKGLRLRRTTGQATTLESHKSLNYYLGGLGDSSSPEVVVQLYQYGQQQEIVSYSTISEGKLIKCHFDPYGAKFAGADSRGDVHIWKFDAAPSSIRPCLTLRQCHQGTISDFTFLNSSSILATAGLSANSMNICIWDTLLPPSRARVKSFQVGEAGIKSILYSAEHNILVAGGRKGNIFVLDMRQDISLLNTFPAHESMITSIALDRQSNLICSGSSRGKIKLFDINALHLEVPTENNMPLPVLDEGVGVVDIQVYNNDYYTCYANGTIFKTTKLDRI